MCYHYQTRNLLLMAIHVNLKLPCESHSIIGQQCWSSYITSYNIDAMSEHDQGSHEMSLRDMFVKDAFLVFRALCKLTMKPLNMERLVTVVQGEHLKNAISQWKRSKITCYAFQTVVASSCSDSLELTHVTFRRLKRHHIFELDYWSHYLHPSYQPVSLFEFKP